jgi:pimeloyl-ACP methyl ester carboxylesterase
VVLLHGLASSCRTWDLLAPLLRRHFQVVALDQRGHGQSAKPAEGYDFPNITADIHAFLTALGLERPLLVGHSWGARVVLEYGAVHPHDPTGMVLLDGGTGDLGARPGRTWERVAQEMAPPDLTALTPAQFLERVRSRSTQIPWSPEREAALLSLFEVTPRGTITPRLSRENHMKILRAMWENPSSPRFPQVQCPVLLMPARQAQEADQERLKTKEEGVARALRTLPRARLVWMEDSIHDVHLQRPQAVAQVITDAAAGGFFVPPGEAAVPRAVRQQA